MATRLRFPKGSSFSFLRQFVRDGAAVDISGGTVTGYLKYSPDDDDADAISALTIAVTNSALGIVRVTLPGAITADLPRSIEYYWRVEADMTGGDILAPEALHGPVALTPEIQLVNPGFVAETLVPSEASDLTALSESSFLGIRSDITSAALHRAVVTAGRTPLPWVIATLEDGQFLTWTLRTRAGEVDDGTSYRVPDDYNITTNPVIWVKTALA